MRAVNFPVAAERAEVVAVAVVGEVIAKTVQVEVLVKVVDILAADVAVAVAGVGNENTRLNVDKIL
jgi:hypothetical protein